MSPWPFPEPPESRALSVWRVTVSRWPVLLVSHDAEDGLWQFLTGDEVQASDARMTTLGEMLQLDPTLAALADLPRGWQATRADAESPWERSPIPPDEETPA